MKGQFMEITTLTKDHLLDEGLFDSLREILISEVKSLIMHVEDVLNQGPLLVPIPKTDVMVIGDTHGDIEVGISVVREFLSREGGTRIVFLGDYVDRGPHPVDNVVLMLLLKLLLPRRVTLLRGNHEIADTNMMYGFYNCINRQFGKQDAKILWFMFNRLFKDLPLAAVNEGIFMVHGGIPEHLQSIHEINNLPREMNPENQEVIEMLWNDPRESKKFSGYRDSLRGYPVKEFGIKAFNDFLSMNHLHHVIRAHEVITGGYKYLFNDRLLSIFSSRKNSSRPFEKKMQPKYANISKNGEITVDDINIQPIT
ncbi:MAG: metallophosphoesterase [Promethearchaeota archaeon]